MVHLNPDRLLSAMSATGSDVGSLASASGVRADFLDEALTGRRRLDVAAMQALAGPLGMEWSALRCDHLMDKRPPCAGCTARNVLTAADLADAGEAFRQLLAEARTEQIADVAQWSNLPGFAHARRVLVAVGGDIDLKVLGEIGAGSAPRRDEIEHRDLAMRLATYCAHGDTDTDEIVGLDISGDIPNGLRIAGWDLVRFTDHDLDEYEVVVASGVRNLRWDRTSASFTWWLRRNGGIKPALGDMSMGFTDPADVAVAPRVTLALLKNESLGALSHGWAQKGRRVSLSVMSRQLDYVFEDGYPQHIEYGQYRVEAEESSSWARSCVLLGGLVEHVFDANTKAAQRYAAAAERFLGVGAILYRWNPLPRLALEMSTAAEMLLLSGDNEGEFSRRFRISAAWLGGINDDDRQLIHDLAKKIYDAGSKYRHAGEHYDLHYGDKEATGKKQLDVLRAYELLRRLMLHGLAVVASGESPADLCDQVQREEIARARLMEIITEFYAKLAITPRPFPKAQAGARDEPAN